MACAWRATTCSSMTRRRAASSPIPRAPTAPGLRMQSLGFDRKVICGRASIRLDARRLDDRPPLINVGSLQRSKHLRRLFLARRNFVLSIGETLAHLRDCQGMYDGGIEPGDDV